MKFVIVVLILIAQASGSAIAGGLGSFIVGAGDAAQGATDMRYQLNQNRLMDQQAQENALRMAEMERQFALRRKQQAANSFQQLRLQQVAAINSASPKMVDSNTRLDGAAYQDRVFSYIYTLPNIEATQIPAQAKDRQYASMRSAVCSDANTRTILNQGDALRYAYRDKYGAMAIQFVYRATDCN